MILVVVLVLETVIVASFTFLYLFQSKDMLVEVVLQLLIGKVNAQLFKAVVQKILKPKDIQNTNGTPLDENKKIINIRGRGRGRGKGEGEGKAEEDFSLDGMMTE